MAEHLRNEMARGGAAVRPSQIMTLAQFLDTKTTAPRPAPAALVHLLIRDALTTLQPARFKAVAGYRGFHAAIAAVLEESHVGPLPAEVAEIAAFVERGLKERGLASRPVRLAAARMADAPRQIVIDGFFSLSHGERTMIEAVARQTAVTITLPETDAGLVRAGFVEHRLDGRYRNARTNCFSAPSLEREAEEIARRILDEAGRGRAFREMGVVLRVREPYGATLETTFARFGIPARSYFATPLDRTPATAYLSRVVGAMLDGWDHGRLLAALRMPVSGIGGTAEGDRFDFEMRERLPDSGLPLPQAAAFLTRFDAWRRDRATAREWAARLKQLRTIVPGPEKDVSPDRCRAGILRSVVASLEAFESVVDEAASFGEHAMFTLAEFWDRVALGLSLAQLRVADRRRNVVHVMDVFEARQWELPVVFVCGLAERHFPQYHRQDSLLDDAARRRAGLRTSAEREREEQFLFDLATTRATEQTVLSYARFDEKGEETLRSFFLGGIEAVECDQQVRPAPVREVPQAPPPLIRAEGLLAMLGDTHATLGPTSIESFLQCPFQFFAEKTLRLRARPAAPRDRLDVRLQGIILHRALAESSRIPLLARAIFEDVFAEECRRARVLRDYRTEAVRLELARHFAAFLHDRRVATGWETSVEEEFKFALNPALSIRGRIDRMDVSPRNEALVIDYKYSAGEKIRERVEECAAGNLVQGGLYLIAAEKYFSREPAGMLYCGLRKEVVWDGWHAVIGGLDGVGETASKARLRELMDAAAAKAREAFEAIRAGVIAPRPADRDKCRWCDYRDTCRIESAGATREAGAR